MRIRITRVYTENEYSISAYFDKLRIGYTYIEIL